jgi:tetratricopeptide (TPR) repeat protein
MIRVASDTAVRFRFADSRQARPRMLWMRLFLLGLILLAFGRTLANEFVDWDDSVLVYQNPNFNPPTMKGLLAGWNPRNPSNTGMYDPLVFSTWWVIAQGAQINTPDILGATLNPLPFHAANLLVHWISACLVLEILLQLGLTRWPATLGAAIFAIHPLQTEPVAWITGMKDLLSNALALSAIYCHLTGLRLPAQQRSRRDWLAFGIFVLGLLAKPSVIVTPPIIWVLDVLLLNQPWKKSAARLAVWIIPGIPTALLARWLQPTHFLATTPLWSRPLVALDALAFYLAKLLVPIDLNFDYGRTPTALLRNVDLHNAIYWTWSIPLIVAGAILLSRRKQLIAAGLIFALGVAPVLGLTPFIYQFYSTVADRYAYLSMLGVALAVAWILQNYNKRLLYGVISGLLILYCGLSFAQSAVWADSETLYERGIKLNPDNPNHWEVFASYRDAQADVALRKAKLAAANGDTPEAQFQAKMRTLYLQMARDDFQHAIDLNIRTPSVYDRLISDLIYLGQFQDAADMIQQSIDLQPSLPPNKRESMGALHYELGLDELRMDQLPQAKNEFEQSLAIKEDPLVRASLQEVEQKMLAASQPATAASPPGSP